MRICDLRARCQPDDLDVSIYRRKVVRRLSIYFTWFFLKVGISANTISVTKGLIGVSGAVLFAGKSVYWLLAGILLLQFSHMLDACDGEIARYTGTCAKSGGEFIDKLGDVVSRSILHLCWGLGTYHLSGRIEFLLAGAVVSGLWLSHRFCLVDTLLESIAKSAGESPPPELREALRKTYVRDIQSGWIEYTLSALYHPYINLVGIFVLAEIFLPSVHLGNNVIFVREICLGIYTLLWMTNALRKTVQGFRSVNVSR